jgi:hypothetical protein
MSLKIVPETISIRTSGSIINEDIVWMSNPEASRSLIRVQKTPRSLCLHNQITFDIVVGFNSIFNKDGVTFNFIGNVVFKSQVMSSVKCKGSIISLMGSKTFSV